jgi:glycosyltransferase involved in cell wall biosynthesis
MADRRLLLLIHPFPPMWPIEGVLAAKRIAGLRGWATDVVCDRGFGVWAGDDHSLDGYLERTFASVERVPLPAVFDRIPRAQLRMLVRIPDEYRLLNGALRRAVGRRDLSSYDAILSWSQFHSVHLVAEKVARRAGAPPWIEGADRVLVTSEESDELILGRYGDAVRAKGRVLPHAWDESLYPPRDQVRREGPLTLRYVGHFYEPRSPEPLFRALAALALEPGQVRVEIVGRVEPHMLETDAYRALPEGTVVVRDPVDYVPSLAIAAEADVLLVVDAPARSSPFLPSKLIDYVGARRPIVGLTPPGSADALIRRIGGWAADPTDPAACAEALRSGIEWAREGRDREFGDPAVRAEYDNAVVGRQLGELLAELGR